MYPYRIEIKWALIFSLMTIVWMFLEKLIGLHSTHIDKHPIYTNLILLPTIIIYVLALKNKNKIAYHDMMTFKEGFISGLIMTFIILILTPLIQFIITNWISPEYFSNMIKYSIEKGYMTQTGAEAYFNLKSYLIQMMLGTIGMGTLLSALTAYFLRNKKTHDL